MQIHACTDAGKRVRVEMALDLFQQHFPTGLRTGDRIAKLAGAWYPTLVDEGASVSRAAHRP